MPIADVDDVEILEKRRATINLIERLLGNNNKLKPIYYGKIDINGIGLSNWNS